MYNGLKAIGANRTKEREINDYYATEPKAVEELLKLETFDKNIWECACGENHITHVLRDNGYNVRASDLIVRTEDAEQIDFLKSNEHFNGDIITNPPYKFSTEFVYKALDSINDGNKIAMFLKVQFLEGKKRKMLFQEFPPKVIYVSSSRLNCAKNGDFDSFNHSSAIAYAWYIWEKGYKGDTLIKWFN